MFQDDQIIRNLTRQTSEDGDFSDQNITEKNRELLLAKVKAFESSTPGISLDLAVANALQTARNGVLYRN